MSLKSEHFSESFSPTVESFENKSSTLCKGRAANSNGTGQPQGGSQAAGVCIQLEWY